MNWPDVFMSTKGNILPIVVKVLAPDLVFYVRSGGGYVGSNVASVDKHLKVGEIITILSYTDLFFVLRETSVGAIYLSSVSRLFDCFEPVA